MAGSPPWKIYDTHGIYQASAKEAEAATVLAEWYGDGATVRAGHNLIVWRHGEDTLNACENYENVVALIESRLEIHRKRGK